MYPGCGGERLPRVLCGYLSPTYGIPDLSPIYGIPDLPPLILKTKPSRILKAKPSRTLKAKPSRDEEKSHRLEERGVIASRREVSSPRGVSGGVPGGRRCP